MALFPPQTSLTLLALLSAAALAAVWVLQYGFGYWPCPLCLWQRWPHYAVIFLALFARFFPATVLACLALAAVSFTANAGLALYHAGAEWQFWPGPSFCAAGAPPVFTAQDLASALAAPVLDCSQPALVFAGLSLAGYNLLLCAGAAAFASQQFYGRIQQRPPQ